MRIKALLYRNSNNRKADQQILLADIKRRKMGDDHMIRGRVVYPGL